MPKTAPFGTWESPITSDFIVQNSNKVADIIVDPVTSAIYHLEARPSEGGRVVVVKTEEGKDLFGPGWNARSGVHEYGGGAARAYDGVVYFSNFADGRVYSVKGIQEPEPITQESKVHRFADFAIYPQDPRFIVAIFEDHSKATKPDDPPSNVINSLCLIDSQTKSTHVLVSGADFYSAPKFSPDGSHLVWQQWTLPDMPWTGGELYISKVSFDQSGGDHALTVGKATHIAGKHAKISAGYPIWASNNVLIYTSDESGFHIPYKHDLSTGTSTPLVNSPQPLREDFSWPAWEIGFSNVAITSATTSTDKDGDLAGKFALYAPIKNGQSHLSLISLHSGALEEIKSPFVVITSLRKVTNNSVTFVGSKVDEDPQIVICSLKDYAKPTFTALNAHPQNVVNVPKSFISHPQPLTVEIDGQDVRVVYYPPTNPDFQPPEGEKPPLIVSVHGGPTSSALQSLNMKTQFFTSRGWAWLDVDYSGSTGYGRDYIRRLDGQWGVIDIRDCAQAPLHLPSSAPVDINRLSIRGSSAGGYTTLQSLVTYPSTFKAATSMYGISDLKSLDQFTHKFESGYSARLLGLKGKGYEKEDEEVYKQRSPIWNVENIQADILVEQGSLDRVVPPSQASEIVKKIKEKNPNSRVDYVVFEGEGHGWRKSENIKKALETELKFYEEVFAVHKGDN
ncbi:alpha/beta-hydrolase [Abortiporus biennis]|nr:alpha/beta-hydrolase [Abortiporus biennis]